VVFLTFLIPVLVLVLLHPARRELLQVHRVHPLLLLVAAVAAVPLVVYGVDQALIQRNNWPPASDPHHNSHWFLMAELAFAIPLLAAVAGLGSREWRVPAWTAVAALAVLGIVSVLFPAAASSLGIGWGLLALVAAVAVAAVSVLPRRRGRAEATPTAEQ
jgi:drug/metabolite transporter (DMT)-like permease